MSGSAATGSWVKAIRPKISSPAASSAVAIGRSMNSRNIGSGPAGLGARGADGDRRTLGNAVLAVHDHGLAGHDALGDDDQPVRLHPGLDLAQADRGIRLDDIGDKAVGPKQ